jgi:hypothetical protein
MCWKYSVFMQQNVQVNYKQMNLKQKRHIYELNYKYDNTYKLLYWEHAPNYTSYHIMNGILE